jgi:outer membrane protein assembly factor BamB
MPIRPGGARKTTIDRRKTPVNTGRICTVARGAGRYHLTKFVQTRTSSDGKSQGSGCVADNPVVQSFSDHLRRLRVAAGSPSLSDIRTLSGKTLERSTISDHLSGKRANPPPWDFVRHFFAACVANAELRERDIASLGTSKEWADRLDAATDGVVDAPCPVRGRPDSIGPKRDSDPTAAVEPKEPEPDAKPTDHVNEPAGNGDSRLDRKPKPYQIAVIVLALAVVIVAIVVVPRLVRHGDPRKSDHAVVSAIPVPVWQHVTADSVDGSPALADGVVYVADDSGVIYALNARSGHLIWAYRTHQLIDSTPAIDGDRLLVGNDAGNLYSIDIRNGSLLWVRKFAGGIDSSPAIANGVAYFGDGYDYVDAVSVASGRTVWRYETGQNVDSSPAVYNGVVYVGSNDHYVYAIDAMTGMAIWKLPTMGVVDSSPTAVDGIVYVGSDDHYLYALNVQSGQIKWAARTDGAITDQPFVYQGVVYAGSHDGALYAFAVASGRRLWRAGLGGITNSSPIISDGVIYIGSAVSDSNGRVDAFSLQGKLVWSYQTSGEVQSSPAVYDGLVYIGSDDNEVVALRQATES